MLRPDDPTTIGGFRLQVRLGAGGMGDFFLAFDSHSQAVALKTLPRGAGHEARTRLKREAELLSGVHSAHISRCLACDVSSSGVRWIAMEYVQGPTSSKHPSRCPTPSSNCWPVAWRTRSSHCTSRGSSTERQAG